MYEWLPWVLLFAVAVLAVVGFVGWWRARGRVGRSNRRRGRVAAVGEHLAEALLERHGYRVVERQARRGWDLDVDGELCAVTSIADLLVERRGRRYVAEVKTGDRAPDPTRPATRRQLLEYRLAFEVDGVLLVDMRSGRLLRIRFPLLC